MSNISCLIKLSQSFHILASEITLFTFVPKNAIDSIKTKGLLSAEELVKDKKALNLARPNDSKSFKKKVEEKLEDPEMKELVGGISAFFTLPDWTKITKKHNIHKLDLIPITINLSKLMKEEPKTKLIGVELAIYKDNMSDEEFDKRQKELSLDEVMPYTLKGPAELWKGYDVTHTTHYASDVPHLIIVTPNKKIDAKYLKL